jgi:hypothetical protein
MSLSNTYYMPCIIHGETLRTQEIIPDARMRLNNGIVRVLFKAQVKVWRC